MGIRLTLADVQQELVATLTCACSEVVMKSHGETEKVRAKVVLIKGNQVFAVCKRCNAEVLLPLRKAVAQSKQPVIDCGPPLILGD